jgi:hypothetical protein
MPFSEAESRLAMDHLTLTISLLNRPPAGYSTVRNSWKAKRYRKALRFATCVFLTVAKYQTSLLRKTLSVIPNSFLVLFMTLSQLE